MCSYSNGYCSTKKRRSKAPLFFVLLFYKQEIVNFFIFYIARVALLLSLALAYKYLLKHISKCRTALNGSKRAALYLNPRRSYAANLLRKICANCAGLNLRLNARLALLALSRSKPPVAFCALLYRLFLEKHNKPLYLRLIGQKGF